MKKEKELEHSDLTGSVLGCCFEVAKELGCGFLESVYKNALFIAMKQKGLKCCGYLLPEHQAQLINYLKAAQIIPKQAEMPTFQLVWV